MNVTVRKEARFSATTLGLAIVLLVVFSGCATVSHLVGSKASAGSRLTGTTNAAGATGAKKFVKKYPVKVICYAHRDGRPSPGATTFAHLPPVCEVRFEKPMDERALSRLKVKLFIDKVDYPRFSEKVSKLVTGRKFPLDRFHFVVSKLGRKDAEIFGDLPSKPHKIQFWVAEPSGNVVGKTPVMKITPKQSPKEGAALTALLAKYTPPAEENFEKVGEPILGTFGDYAKSTKTFVTFPPSKGDKSVCYAVAMAVDRRFITDPPRPTARKDPSNKESISPRIGAVNMFFYKEKAGIYWREFCHPYLGNAGQVSATGASSWKDREAWPVAFQVYKRRMKGDELRARVKQFKQIGDERVKQGKARWKRRKAKCAACCSAYTWARCRSLCAPLGETSCPAK